MLFLQNITFDFICTTVYQYISKNNIEVLAAIFSLVCVWLNMRVSIWGWVFSIIAAGLYLKIFIDAKLVGSALMQIMFIILSFYGLYCWFFDNQLDSKKEKEIIIKHFPKEKTIQTFIIFVFLLITTIFVLKYFDGTLVYLDALLLVLSALAQFMLAKKYIENWLFWIFINVIAVIQYINADLHVTAVLYFLLLLMAIKGYFDWRKILRFSSKWDSITFKQ